MSDAEDPVLLRLHPRPSAPMTVTMPLDVIAAIEDVAAIRDMSPEAVLRFYIGQGLRVDAAELFPEPPQYLRRRNLLTRQALDDAEAQRDLKNYASTDELFADLFDD